MKRFLHWSLFVGAAGLAAVIPLAGCHDDDDDDDVFPANYVQVERLARPAINEGLFTTNDFLNAVNSIRPDQDAAALTGAVAAEAIGTIDALDGLAGGDNTNAADWVAALIPDVMRINTALNIPVGDVAFSQDVTLFGPTGGVPEPAVRPAGGRKLHDDVIDIISTILVVGPLSLPVATDYATLTPDATGVSAYPVNDGVPYYRPTMAPGNANPAIGHQLLNGQVTRYGAATYPFLAPAN
jgi:hypothetical protein